MTEKPPETIEETVALLELQNITNHELRVRRTDSDLTLDTGLPEDEVFEGDPDEDWTMKVKVFQDDDTMTVRVRGRTRRDNLEVIVDTAADYSKSSAAEVPEELVVEFIRRVAVMTLHPYMRQSVQDLSSRAGESILLHYLKAAEVHSAKAGD